MTNTTTRPDAVQRQDEQTAAIRTVIAYTRVADRTRARAASRPNAPTWTPRSPSTAGS